MNTGPCRVEGQLPYGDSHSSGTLVAESKNPFVIRDYDQLNFFLPGIMEQGWNSADVIGGDPQSTGPPKM